SCALHGPLTAFEAEELGDRDEAERYWQQGVERLRQSYTQPGEGDRPRVDPRNAEDFGLAFDSLANRHAYSLGRRTLELRYAERRANEMALGQEMTQLYAGGDDDTRAVAQEQYFAAVEANVEAGVYDAAEGQRRKQGFLEQGDNARAIALIDADPQAYRDAREGGAFAGLQADRLARYDAQAQTALERQAEARQREAEKAAAERQREIGDRLAEIRKIAGRGFDAVDEEFLADPEVQAHPDYAQTRAVLELRDDGTLIEQATPAELREAVDASRRGELAFASQAERVEVMEEALARHEQGYAADPVAYAAEVGLDVPELPEFDPADPDAYAEALAERVAFGTGLEQRGYTGTARALTNEEREQLVAQTGPEADPETRVKLARRLPAVLGRAGADSFESLELDPVFRHTAGLVSAGGGSDRLGARIFAGQQAIEEGNVVMPPARERIDPAFETLGELFADLPGGEALQAEVRAAADAHYAAGRRRTDPSGDIDEQAYRQSLHAVLGGLGRYDSRDALGGVQEVRDRPTLLPPGVRGRDVEAALDSVAEAGRETLRGSRIRKLERPAPEALDAVWRRVTGGPVPRVAGEPLDPRDLDEMQIEARGDRVYILTFATNDGRRRTVYDQDGTAFTFDLRDLLREVAR
ncbi:MAG: hypothetical protein ACLFTP_04990, partial [Rhodosalinus sp.]